MRTGTFSTVPHRSRNYLPGHNRMTQNKLPVSVFFGFISLCSTLALIPLLQIPKTRNIIAPSSRVGALSSSLW